MDSEVSGRIGLRAVIYYISTTIIAVILGEQQEHNFFNDNDVENICVFCIKHFTWKHNVPNRYSLGNNY